MGKTAVIKAELGGEFGNEILMFTAEQLASAERFVRFAAGVQLLNVLRRIQVLLQHVTDLFQICKIADRFFMSGVGKRIETAFL